MIPCIQSQIESNIEKIDEINEALKSSQSYLETGVSVEESLPTHVSFQSLGIKCEECDKTIAINQLALHCNNCDLFFHKECTDKRGAWYCKYCTTNQSQEKVSNVETIVITEDKDETSEDGDSSKGEVPSEKADEVSKD